MDLLVSKKSRAATRRRASANHYTTSSGNLASRCKKRRRGAVRGIQLAMADAQYRRHNGDEPVVPAGNLSGAVEGATEYPGTGENSTDANLFTRWSKKLYFGFHQYLLFGYFSPFMRLAKTEGSAAVRPENLPELWPSDDVEVWANRFFVEIDHPESTHRISHCLCPPAQSAVLSALFSVFKRSFLIIFCIKIALTLLGLSSVFMMTSFLEWQELDPRTTTANDRARGALSGVGILLLELSSIFIATQCGFWIERVSIRIQASLVAGLFRSIVSASPNKKRHTTSEASAYNILMVDVGSVGGFIFAVIDIIVLPVKILLSYPMLLHKVGPAARVGLGTLVVVMLVMLLLEIRSGVLKAPYLHHRDARIAKCHESVMELRGLRMLGWEDIAAHGVEGSRAVEMRYRRKRMYLDTFAAAISNGAYVFTQLSIFAVYIIWGLRHNPNFVFKASVAIPVVQLIARLVGPFNNLPFTVNALIEGWISCERYYTYVFGKQKLKALESESRSSAFRETIPHSTATLPWEVSPLLPTDNQDCSDIGSKPRSPVTLSESEDPCSDLSSCIDDNEDTPHSVSTNRISVERAIFSWVDLPMSDKLGASDYRPSQRRRKSVTLSSGNDRFSVSVNFVPRHEARPRSTSVEDDSASTYVSQQDAFRLSIPELRVNIGECVAVSGASGKGKSSVVLSLLGEMIQHGGQYRIGSATQSRRFRCGKSFPNGNDSLHRRQNSCCIGYASQVPWIPEGTVRSIILFGRPYVQRRYERVIRACELGVDIHTWAPDGDQRSIPEGGVNLSGGQRSRIALARALYGYPDLTDPVFPSELITSVFLLDDPFGSIDPSVAPTIFQNLFGNNGILQHAATVLTIDETSFTFYSNSLRSGEYFSVALMLYILKDGVLLPSPIHARNTTASNTIRRRSPTANGPEAITNADLVDENQAGQAARPLVTDTLNAAAFCKEEALCSGAVGTSTYWWYTKRAGFMLLTVIAILTLMTHLSSFGSDVWLAYWTYLGSKTLATDTIGRSTAVNGNIFFLETSHHYHPDVLSNSSLPLIQDSHPVNSPNRVSQNLYSLYVYSILSLTSVATLIILYFLGIYTALRAAIIIHRNLLRCLIKAPYWMYDFLPVGIIVNRFSSDTDVVDGGPVLTLSYFFSSCVYFTLTVIGLSLLSPWCSPLIPIVGFLVYTFVYQLYRPTCRELQRSRLTALSPLCGHLSEVESGATVIRAFAAEGVYHKKNIALTSDLMKTQFMQVGSSSWATTRLQLLSFPFTLLNSVIPIVLRLLQLSAPVDFVGKLISTTDGTSFTSSAGFIGIGISLALALPSSIGALVWSFASLEQKMCSVQRVQTLVNELSQLTSGDNVNDDSAYMSGDWKPSSDILSPIKSPKPRLGLHQLSGTGRFKSPTEEPESGDLEEHSSSLHWSPQRYGHKNSPLLTRTSELSSKRTGIKVRNLEVCYHKIWPRTKDAPMPGGPVQFVEKPALHGVTASAKPGESIGIVGRTGSGKTTFLLALLNLLPATHGYIFIDNLPLHRLSPSLLKKVVGILPQFPPVLRGWTIRKFLDPDDQFRVDRLYKAVNDVGLQRIIKRLPQSLDTVLHPAKIADNTETINSLPEGPTLSDSQIRMLTLARLSLHADTYRLVLVDEPPPRQLTAVKLPTSGGTRSTKVDKKPPHPVPFGEAGTTVDMDEKSSSVSAEPKVFSGDDEEDDTDEPDIADIIKRLFPKSTILIVAHHAATFKHCNHFWVFSRGELKGIEEGSSVRSQEQLTKIIQKYETVT